MFEGIFANVAVRVCTGVSGSQLTNKKKTEKEKHMGIIYFERKKLEIIIERWIISNRKEHRGCDFVAYFTRIEKRDHS